jgi:hypothetical protein
MSHEFYSVTNFEIVAPYTLRLTYDDGAVNTIDFLPVLRGELFSPLRDLNFFNQVRLDSEAGNIVWPNGADFDPETLHEWEKVGREMIEMASNWEIVAQPDSASSFEHIVATARQLEPSEKIMLIRILAQDLENYAEKIAPFEPFTTYRRYTPDIAPGAATSLKEAMEEYDAEPQEKDQE